MATEKRAQRGAFAAKMLVRALKVLGYFRNEIARTDIDTAALDQPGDEGALMAETNEIGNAELPISLGGPGMAAQPGTHYGTRNFSTPGGQCA